MTFEEFIKDEANLAKFEKCETQADVDALLAAEGVVTPEVGDELDENDLEGVAGGISLVQAAKVLAWIISHWDDCKKVASDINSIISKGIQSAANWYNNNKSRLKKLGAKVI